MGTTPRHAGFASVATIQAGLINELLAAASSLAPSPSFALPSPIQVGSDSVSISGTLAIVPPVVAFAANPDNLIAVTCGAAGTLTFLVNGTVLQVELTLTSTINVSLLVDVSPSLLALVVDLSHATISDITVSVEVGPPLTAVYQIALQDSSVLNAFSSALQSVPQSATTFSPPGATGTFPFTISTLTVTLPFSRVLVIPMDGNALTIAADVAPYTAGDPTQLVNLFTTPAPGPLYFTVDASGDEDGPQGNIFGGNAALSSANISTAVNGDFLSSMVSGQVSPQLNGLTVASGTTLESLSLAVGMYQSVIGQSNLPTNRYGCISVSGSGSWNTIGFTFSAAVTPILFSTPSQTYWDFSIVNYSYGSNALTAAEIVLGVLTAGIGGLILNSTIESIIANLVSNLALSAPRLLVNGGQSLPGIPGWSVSYNLMGIVIWQPESGAAEIDGYIAGDVSGPSPALPPPPTFHLTAPPHALQDPSPLPVSVSVSDSTLFNALLALRISWTAVRQDTLATVLSQDTPLTQAATSISIDRWSGDAIYNDTWTVTCEVYRPADSLTPHFSYFSQSIETGVTDVVDRRHPYAHWNHEVFIHDPHGPGPLKTHSFWTRNRKSAIHRTDILTRCSMLDRAMNEFLSKDASFEPSYLDSIASYGSQAQLESHQPVDKGGNKVLCDYCFFGGPTKVVWRNPTAPTPDWV